MTKMNEYTVSFMCVYCRSIIADSPEEAAKIAKRECEYDIDGAAYVENEDTGEEWEI